jgi:MtN3 and saliva related transmembrane protein
MDPWQIVGTVGILSTSAQLIPQVIKSVRTRRVDDLSIGLSIIVGISALSWFVYGIHLRDVPLITANLINLIGALILFGLKVTR